MEIFKIILVLLICAFCIWQIVGFIRDVKKRNIEKYEKEQNIEKYSTENETFGESDDGVIFGSVSEDNQSLEE